jgi:benzil reductase ((S)-benzoin forming)
MKCFIITGTSRGLGESLVTRLLENDNILYGISRNKNERLETLALEKRGTFVFCPFDLLNLDRIENLVKTIIQETDNLDVNGYYLLNNAGVVTPIKTADQCAGGEMIRSFHVNTLAPMILTASFIKMTQQLNVDKRIINISSGAARKPYYGWSSYCSSKAAIDRFTQCVAIEQQSQPYPVKILSFAPGIIDTGMQQEIRTSKKEDFDQLERFKGFKEKGQLLSADFVAGSVIEALFDDETPSGSLMDIRDRM